MTRPERSLHRSAFAVAIVVLLGHVSAATAQSGDEEDGVRERAMALFDQARRQIDDGDASAGIASCEEAYGIYPTPGALARLGACYEWADRTEDAVDTYRRIWSSSAADQSVREFAADALERLTGERPVETPTQSAEPDERRGPIRTDAASDEPSHTAPWIFTVGAIVLAAGAGVGGAWTYSLWSDLDGQADDLRAIRASHLPPYDEPDYAVMQADIDDRNSTLKLVSQVTLAVGAAAVVSGVVALVLWLTSD